MELSEISKCYIVVKPLAVDFIAAVLHIEKEESQRKLFQTIRDAGYLTY
jgi:enoyl reductase-like protein